MIDGIPFSHAGISKTWCRQNGIYRKHVEIITDGLFDNKIVHYSIEQKKKIPFIIEFNLDSKTLVKVRSDKRSSNSINTFNSVLLASYQK